MFDKILIANRGEIAVRIIRTCKRLGMATVAVCSEVDVRARHVLEADEAVVLGEARSSESYLVKEKVLAAALDKGCQAIHPGYGFLSENPDFARLVSQAGLVFVGPPPSAIATLGDKIASKQLARQVGIPTAAGDLDAINDVAEARKRAQALGYPVLLKPAAGGGGKGMRIINEPGGLEAAFAAARQETRKAFGDDTLFMERYILRPRHVEIQILADHHGHVLHLGERECSVQRRYQKIIEESPSVAVNDALRAKMGKMACDLARAAGYTNAGTVEFMLDADGSVYFLEINTRLQVEHPVTEWVTGLDLVELQLRIAAGHPLGFSQEDVSFQGWAIEARVCAEDPSHGFIPSTGMITRYAEPRGKDLRVDSGIQAGSIVSVHYDSLLAKVIAWGQTRSQAIETLTEALNGYHIEGPVTNVNYANQIINHPAFLRGELSTDFIEEHLADASKLPAPAEQHLHVMALTATIIFHARQNLVRDSLRPMASCVGSFCKIKDKHRYRVQADADVFDLSLLAEGTPNTWSITVDGKPYQVITPELEFFRRRIRLQINGVFHRMQLEFQENFIQAAYRGIVRTFQIYSPLEWQLAKFMPRPKAKTADNTLACPMPGLIVGVRVKAGERVYRGQELVTIESMKLESGVSSPCDCEVAAVHVTTGQAVETGDLLVEFKQ
jgi:propionyl-CoA carboxylase alpha chain